ncbi:hypothetical protein VDG05_17445 [Xanthomonas campestris pv. raphani]|uniref:hypothetical protein n=1 Tax=Xanthomonas campestris TaxID=339 RepID=UPI002B23DDEB|nr:hypothetical protein [Xanthomonas campestris]MEA9886093.1 hypothetical protein [Xanthomonas campestris pv. raphani]
MSEMDSSEAYVFQVSGTGLPETPPVLLLIAQGSARIMEGHDDYERILSNFSAVKNRITKKKLSEFAPQIFEVISVRFFSQETGLEVIEFASFEGNNTVPLRSRFAVKRTGQELTLYSSQSLTAAAGWMAAENKKIIFRGAVTRLVVSAPQKKKTPRI